MVRTPLNCKAFDFLWRLKQRSVVTRCAHREVLVTKMEAGCLGGCWYSPSSGKGG